MAAAAMASVSSSSALTVNSWNSYNEVTANTIPFFLCRVPFDGSIFASILIWFALVSLDAK